jgi:hypothetical protein
LVATWLRTVEPRVVIIKDLLSCAADMLPLLSLFLPHCSHRPSSSITSDGMVVCHLPYGPTAYFGLFNTVLRHDIGQKKEVGTISEAYPHLVFDKFGSQLGQRIANVLKHLFPVPKDDSKRVVTFANADDYVSFRHHTYSAPKGAKSIELKEVSASSGSSSSSCGGGGSGGVEVLWCRNKVV